MVNPRFPRSRIRIFSFFSFTAFASAIFIAQCIFFTFSILYTTHSYSSPEQQHHLGTYARKVKLESSKLVKIFAELSRNLSDLMNKAQYRTLCSNDAVPADESVVRQWAKEVKRRIKTTREVISEAMEPLDNQLKNHKLKDTIFAL